MRPSAPESHDSITGSELTCPNSHGFTAGPKASRPSVPGLAWLCLQPSAPPLLDSSPRAPLRLALCGSASGTQPVCHRPQARAPLHCLPPALPPLKC
ncbi:hypothetical protein GUJ93_ZPchr0011g27137 [Zizania palustris]|uniref:Uncharacterized protein n=1 Tax=Zizania palustris TaxID=103762 RepID=A0A8J6BP48_ZIZPA|nr:hypothetical protein GUJ93_ZPchr0011g27137 [Zizania palustris]